MHHAWGCWYAEASLDGEVTLAPKTPVTLQIADLTMKGAILSGGPGKGRSDFRIVGGAAGWGDPIKADNAIDDSGVKMSKVIADAARLAGETVDTATIPDTRLGSGWTRPSGAASRVLELVAPKGWYVGEDGVTRLGARPIVPLPAKVTRVAPVDRARHKVVLASDSIAAILPGVVVDGMTAVDVQHEISADGLRSTVWGESPLEKLESLLSQLDPDRKFRGVSEYRVIGIEGKRLNLQPVRRSTGMPDLPRVRIRPGVPGCDATVALGAIVFVAFADADESMPFVISFDDPEAANFQPTSLSLLAKASAGGEHIATVEGTTLLIYNVLVALMAAAGGGPLLAAVLQPLIGAAISAALAAQAAPAPPGQIAQAALSATLQAGFAAGTTPSPAMFAAWTTAIAALSTKTPNASGDFPSLGCAAVEGG
jgi:hypothetical protein